jgi:hypothetical protein
MVDAQLQRRSPDFQLLIAGYIDNTDGNFFVASEQ